MTSLMSVAVKAEKQEGGNPGAAYDLREMYQAVMEDAKAEASLSPTAVGSFEQVTSYPSLYH